MATVTSWASFNFYIIFVSTEANTINLSKEKFEGDKFLLICLYSIYMNS